MSARRITGRENVYDEAARRRFSLQYTPTDDMKVMVAIKVERSINEDPFFSLSAVLLGAIPSTTRLNFLSVRFGGSQLLSLSVLRTPLQFTEQGYFNPIGEMCSVRHTRSSTAS
jgi:hypothetical protein